MNFMSKFMKHAETPVDVPADENRLRFLEDVSKRLATLEHKPGYNRLLLDDISHEVGKVARGKPVAHLKAVVTVISSYYGGIMVSDAERSFTDHFKRSGTSDFIAAEMARDVVTNLREAKAAIQGRQI